MGHMVLSCPWMEVLLGKPRAVVNGSLQKKPEESWVHEMVVVVDGLVHWLGLRALPASFQATLADWVA